MRTRKRRTGGSPAWVRSAALALLSLALAAGTLQSGDKDKKKKADAAFAVVAGSVFRNNGMSLAGAEVILTSGGDSQEAKKFKKIIYITDARGEFAIRVPARKMEYKVSVSAPGYQTGEKSVTIAGEERVDVFIQLEAASKK